MGGDGENIEIKLKIKLLQRRNIKIKRNYRKLELSNKLGYINDRNIYTFFVLKKNQFIHNKINYYKYIFHPIKS